MFFPSIDFVVKQKFLALVSSLHLSGFCRPSSFLVRPSAYRVSSSSPITTTKKRRTHRWLDQSATAADRRRSRQFCISSYLSSVVASGFNPQLRHVFFSSLFSLGRPIMAWGRQVRQFSRSFLFALRRASVLWPSN